MLVLESPVSEFGEALSVSIISGDGIVGRVSGMWCGAAKWANVEASVNKDVRETAWSEFGDEAAGVRESADELSESAPAIIDV